jgi:antitoxin component YwqK of YwqJK toxin-antitoxin module
MDNTKYCEYLENISKLLSEKKISEELAKEMLKSFNEMLQSMKEIEINHDNNAKEIELTRSNNQKETEITCSNNQKEMLQIRCTDNGMKVTSMERVIKIADAVVVGCNTMTYFGEPKPIAEQPIVNNQQPVG